MRSDCMGSASIAPEGTFLVSHTGTWTITYTVGKWGIDDGGSIIITRRAMSDAIAPQCQHPAQPGYTTAATSGSAHLDVRYLTRYWIRPYRDAIVVRVYDGSLAPGERIQVTLGDTTAGSPGWTLQTFPEAQHTFRVLADSFGTREYYPIAQHPFICIVPGQPARLDAVLPSTARPGEESPLWVRVLDEWDNPVDTFEGQVEVTCSGPSDLPPRTFSIGEGVQQVGSLRFPTPGVYRLALSCRSLTGQSNPIRVGDDARPVFWADMHGQTEHTVGTGSVREYFCFARDKALMHVTSWQGNDFQVTQEAWQDVCEHTRRFHEPGRFVTFLGYEWSGLTPAGGDHNILYLKDDQPIHRSSHWQVHDGSSENTDRYPLSELWAEFEGRNDVMAVAHAGGRHANLDCWDSDFCGLIEIHSHHGTFEWLAQEAIRRGLIFGLVGQSDDHSGRPGLSAPLRPLARDFATFDVYGGYTGIYAPQLTRPAIWEALRARHCYATSGRRILLDVRCGVHMMGDVIEEPMPAALAVHIAGTAPLLDVVVRRDTQIAYRYPFADQPADLWVRVEWSGVRIKGRSKKVDWEGTISVRGGKIKAFRPYAFDQKAEGVTRLSDTQLGVLSTTSGDIDGVLLKVSGDDPSLLFQAQGIRPEVKVKSLGQTPQAFEAGGVNQQVRFSVCAPDSRPHTLDLTFRDPAPQKGPHAYWVKVAQADGHMAWASPIFLQNPLPAPSSG